MVYCNDTGLPSVTDIIKPYIDTRWFKKEHLHRGSEVHNWTESYLKCTPYMIDVAYQGYCDSAARWIDKYVDKILLVEERMRDDVLGFCGQPDLVCTLNGSSSIVVVDWKTSIQKAVWWALQDAGYRLLTYCNKNRGDVPEGLTIRLRKDGKKALVASNDNYNYHIQVFKCHLTSYQFHYGR